MSLTISIVGIIVLMTAVIDGLQVIWQRAEISYYNKSYVDSPKLYVKRYGRKSAYYLNFEATHKHTWGNNVSLNLVFYEALHNEYRRSFVEMHFDKLCDKLATDKYLGQQLRNAGLTCPLPAGYKYLMNMTAPTSGFPNVWPFENARADVELVVNTNNVTMARARVYLHFMQKKSGSG